MGDFKASFKGVHIQIRQIRSAACNFFAFKHEEKRYASEALTWVDVQLNVSDAGRRIKSETVCSNNYVIFRSS